MNPYPSELWDIDIGDNMLYFRIYWLSLGNGDDTFIYLCDILSIDYDVTDVPIVEFILQFYFFAYISGEGSLFKLFWF